MNGLRKLCPVCGITATRGPDLRIKEHARYAMPQTERCPGPILDYEDTNGLTCPHGFAPLDCRTCLEWKPSALGAGGGRP